MQRAGKAIGRWMVAVAMVGVFAAALPPATGTATQPATSQRGRATRPAISPATEPAATRPAMAGVHESGNWRLPIPTITDLVLSPDGRHLVASYFVPAMNRPGTDWSAWSAHWDLTTGRRTIIPDAGGPLAISRDGQWLVMSRVTHGKPTSFRVVSSPWLWNTAQIKPVRELTYETPKDASSATRPAGAMQPDHVLAWTFAPDSKELYGVTADCTLVGCDVAGEGACRKLAGPGAADFEPLALKTVGWSPWGETGGSGVNLHAWSNEVGLLARLQLDKRPGGPEGAERVYAVSAEWAKGARGWTRLRLDLLKQEPYSRVLSEFLGGSDEPSQLALPLELAKSFVGGDRWPTFNATFRWSDRFAFASKGKMVAFREPGAGIATVRKENLELLAQFPAVEVYAFTPDGKQMIVSDRNGVLRFWDVATGRIVRTLRLDDKPADTVRVAAIQAASEFGKPEVNRKELASQIERAAAAGAQIVVLPETAVTGYADYALKHVWQVGDRKLSDAALLGVDPKDAAETVPGPSTCEFGKLARRLGIYLTVPLLEVDRKTGRYYNTVVLLGPTGETLIHYRKINPWPWAETGWATEGDLGHPVADTPYGRLGVLVCYDIHKQAAALADLKVDTLLYSIAWVEEKDSDWFAKRLPWIARDNKLNIIGANWTLPVGSAAPDWHGYGQSTIIDSKGNILAKADGDIGGKIVLADVPIPADALAAPSGK